MLPAVVYSITVSGVLTPLCFISAFALLMSAVVGVVVG